MLVLALIQRPGHVCSRYRIEGFASDLAARGLRLETLSLAGGAFSRPLRLLAARRAAVVVLQRKLLPAWQLAILAGAARRLVYDFDDAMFLRDSFHPKGIESGRLRRRFRATVRAADAVLAGNGYLHRQAAAVTEAGKVHTLPTVVDPRLYPGARHHRRGSQVRLVWIGSSSTLPSLKLAERHLAAAADRAAMQMRIICDRGVALGGLDVILRPWSRATETAELAAADIGISWLADDAWSRGKCGLKVVQYMAAGLPVVANPVGMNRQMVVHGQTGLLAETPQEWAAAIGRLASRPELRARMGAAGRRLVEEHYSAARWGPRFAEIIASVATGRRPPPARHARAARPTVPVEG